MRFAWVAALAGLTAFSLGLSDVRAQPMDSAAVMQAYTEAINAHDVDKALALVADDAVYHRPTGEFSGKEAVRGFVADLVARDVHVELVGERRVEGEQVFWKSRVTLKDPQNPGAAPTVILNDSQSTVHEGKIVEHSAKRATE